jgi:hypothetical protein
MDALKGTGKEWKAPKGDIYLLQFSQEADNIPHAKLNLSGS